MVKTVAGSSFLRNPRVSARALRYRRQSPSWRAWASRWPKWRRFSRAGCRRSAADGTSIRAGRVADSI